MRPWLLLCRSFQYFPHDCLVLYSLLVIRTIIFCLCRAFETQWYVSGRDGGSWQVKEASLHKAKCLFCCTWSPRTESFYSLNIHLLQGRAKGPKQPKINFNRWSMEFRAYETQGTLSSPSQRPNNLKKKHKCTFLSWNMWKALWKRCTL